MSLRAGGNLGSLNFIRKEEKSMNKIKTFFTTIFTAIFSWLGILAIPVILMVLTNIIDYVTGLMAGEKRGEKINSYKSIRGIIKKVCMWLLVCVGAIIDQLLLYASANAGVSIHFNFLIASLVAIWIIANEIISILENIADIGVELPPFLLPLMKNIKKQTENKMESEDE